MKRDPIKQWLLGGAIVLALAGAAAGREYPRRQSANPPARPVPSIQPYAVARVLSAAAPDVLVVTLDDAHHAMRGAVPVATFGATDAEFVTHVPQGVRIILAGSDAVRVDRLARQLLANRRSVRVLEGGIAAWDAAMSADPPAPATTADVTAWSNYRFDVALRHAFGEAGVAAPTPVPLVVRPAAAPAAAGSGRREGC